MARLDAEVENARQAESLAAKETSDIEDEITALTAALRDPLESLDRRGAYATLRAERDIAITEETLTEELQDLRGWGFRPVRERTEGETLDLLEVSDEVLEQLRERGIEPERGPLGSNDDLGALAQRLLQDRNKLHRQRSTDQELKDRGVHLDQWVNANLPGRLPELWAREDELATRRQRDINSEASPETTIAGVSFERIAIDAGDAAGADLAAADWLRGAAVDASRAGSSAAESPSARWTASQSALEALGRGPGPPTAAWIGSQSTLEALGLDRDTEVTLDRLASAIEGRNVGDGRLVRSFDVPVASLDQDGQAVADVGRPADAAQSDIAIVESKWRPPESVSRLRLAEGPERRAAIDQALFASADASLDEARRTIPLVERRLPDGTVAHEPARGVAAVAIVDRLPRPMADVGGDSPPLHVQTLILAVEDTDGRLVMPNAPAEVGPDVSSAAFEAAQYTLAWELTRLGYEVDRSDHANELFQVSVPWRPERHVYMTQQRAQQVRAQIRERMEGRARTLRSERELEPYRHPGRASSTEIELRPDTVEIDGEVASDPDPQATRRAVEAARLDDRLEIARKRLWTAQEDALVLEGRAAEPGAPPDLLSELASQRNAVDELASELNVLVEERSRLDQVQPEPPGLSGDATSLAVGTSEAAPGETLGSVQPLTARQALSDARQIGRGDVWVPDPFDELDVIGERRRQLYAAQMEPLARWLEDMPSRWVGNRHAQLGPPTAHVDRGAARLTRLIERRVEVAEQDLRQAREAGSVFDIRGLERKLAGLRQQEQQLRDDGLHLDQHTNPDTLIRSAAYAKEHAIRREIARAERTPVIDPPTARLDRAGMPPPDQDGREAYREWRELDADDLESAIEERLLPDQEYERYDGPLGWEAWLEERRRYQELERFGIARPEVPAPYAAALGPERAERLTRLVEDARLGLAYSPRSHEELSAQARLLEAAGGTLNLELSERVAALEQQRDEDLESVHDADRGEIDLWHAAEDSPEGPERDQFHDDSEAERARAALLREGLRTLMDELAGLSGLDDHPDRWFDGDGRRFADALAARLQLEQERTLAGAAPELVDSHELTYGTDGYEPTAPNRAREAPDAGLDIS